MHFGPSIRRRVSAPYTHSGRPITDMAPVPVFELPLSVNGQSLFGAIHARSIKSVGLLLEQIGYQGEQGGNCGNDGRAPVTTVTTLEGI